MVPANFVGGDEQRELIAGETTLPSSSGLEGTQPPTRPLHIRDQEPPLPLRRPGAGTTGASASNEALSSAANPLPSALTVGGSLMIVLSIFFVVAWAMRRAAPQSQVVLPGEVFEMLGRAPLSGRQQVHLLRLGRKLVLVSVTPAGAETLTEVTDADEVDRLAGMCHQAKPGSISASFRTVLEHFGEEFSRKAGTSAEPTGVESPRDQWSPGQWTRTRADAQREARDA
ncbi:MAG: FliO/MopB family protein [Planctomycetota bacterium]